MIEFKEGAVCYADGKQLIYNEWQFDNKLLNHIVNLDDFQLNEPCNGWYIPKSELDTEEKYNQAVEVFGMFGFKPSEHHQGYSELSRYWRGIEICRGELASTNVIDGIKCTFAQLMIIGELKRKMLERDKQADELMPFGESIDLKMLERDKPKSSAVSIVNRDSERLTKNKAKQAYGMLKDLDYEYDLVKQRWYKKQYI